MLDWPYSFTALDVFHLNAESICYMTMYTIFNLPDTITMTTD